MLDIDLVEKYSLSEIYLEESHQLRDALLKLRSEIIYSICQNRISKKIALENPNLSIEKIKELINSVYTEHISTFYFPNDVCCFYPKIWESRSRNIQTCDVSGALIFPNSLYYSYRPLLENLTTKKVYVLDRTIKTEIGYYDFFSTRFI